LIRGTISQRTSRSTCCRRYWMAKPHRHVLVGWLPLARLSEFRELPPAGQIAGCGPGGPPHILAIVRPLRFQTRKLVADCNASDPRGRGRDTVPKAKPFVGGELGRQFRRFLEGLALANVSAHTVRNYVPDPRHFPKYLPPPGQGPPPPA